MKRILLSVSSLLLLLSACGAPQSGYALDDAQTLLDAGLFHGNMGPLSTDTVAVLYRIDQETIIECVSYLSADTAINNDELTILILTDEDAAQVAESACRERVEAQIKTAQNYTPAAVPRLEGAVIHRIKNTVLLAVGDPDRLPQAVNELH